MSTDPVGGALATFAAIERCADESLPPAILGPVRAAVGAILGVETVAVPPADERAAACVAFAEQFVVDVAGITAAQRGAMATAMGNDAFTFVQALYVVDVFTRARIGFARLGLAVTIPNAGEDSADADLWGLLERFMQQVALLGALDPLTSELVRLRGARVHNCRLCQSRRSVKAIDSAGGAAVLDTLDDQLLDDRQRAAVRLADALVTQPRTIDDALVAEARAHFSDKELTEMILDVARNAANKIAVAFGADAPVVTDGVEFYDIDANGDVVADVEMGLVRAATAR